MACDRIALRNYLDGILDDTDEKLAFLLHVDECAKCRTALYDARKAENFDTKYKTRKPKEEQDDMTKREMVIEYVRNNPGQTSGEIGRALKLTPSSATAQLCLLTQLGVLVRERNSEGLYCYRHSDSVEPDTDTAADTTAVEPQQPVTAKTNSGAIQSGHPASSSSHKAVFDEFPQLAGDPLFADVKPNGKSVAPAAMPKAAIGTEDWDNEIIALGEMDAYLNGVPDLFAKRRILNYLAQKHRVEGVIA